MFQPIGKIEFIKDEEAYVERYNKKSLVMVSRKPFAMEEQDFASAIAIALAYDKNVTTHPSNNNTLIVRLGDFIPSENAQAIVRSIIFSRNGNKVKTKITFEFEETTCLLKVILPN